MFVVAFLGATDSAMNVAGGFTDVLGPLAGTAHSVTFLPRQNLAAFDNLEITPVPEPTSAVIFRLSAGLWPLCQERRKKST